MKHNGRRKEFAQQLRVQTQDLEFGHGSCGTLSKSIEKNWSQCEPAAHENECNKLEDSMKVNNILPHHEENSSPIPFSSCIPSTPGKRKHPNPHSPPTRMSHPKSTTTTTTTFHSLPPPPHYKNNNNQHHHHSNTTNKNTMTANATLNTTLNTTNTSHPPPTPPPNNKNNHTSISILGSTPTMTTKSSCNHPSTLQTTTKTSNNTLTTTSSTNNNHVSNQVTSPHIESDVDITTPTSSDTISPTNNEVQSSPHGDNSENPSLSPTADTPRKKQKRHRRTAAMIDRQHACPFLGCGKSYGSEASLNQHVRLKHRHNQTNKKKGSPHLVPGYPPIVLTETSSSGSMAYWGGSPRPINILPAGSSASPSPHRSTVSSPKLSDIHHPPPLPHHSSTSTATTPTNATNTKTNNSPYCKFLVDTTIAATFLPSPSDLDPFILMQDTGTNSLGVGVCPTPNCLSKKINNNEIGLSHNYCFLGTIDECSENDELGLDWIQLGNQETHDYNNHVSSVSYDHCLTSIHESLIFPNEDNNNNSSNKLIPGFSDGLWDNLNSVGEATTSSSSSSSSSSSPSFSLNNVESISTFQPPPLPPPPIDPVDPFITIVRKEENYNMQGPFIPQTLGKKTTSITTMSTTTSHATIKQMDDLDLNTNNGSTATTLLLKNTDLIFPSFQENQSNHLDVSSASNNDTSDLENILDAGDMMSLVSLNLGL